MVKENMMIIRTRFGVGQKAWRIDQGLDDKWRVIDRKHPKQINWIVIDIGHEYVSVEYELKNVRRSWDGAELFPTKTEAQAECDKRNKK